jgi:hypothetical protein
MAFQLLDSKGKVGEPFKVNFRRPSFFLDAKMGFSLSAGGTKGGNTLVAEVFTTPQFRGPACTVELVLDPGAGSPSASRLRHPEGLLKSRLFPPEKRGETSTVSLFAMDLQIAKESTELVTIQVDDFKRAFLFETTFPAKASQPSANKIPEPALRLVAPAAHDPQKPLPVTVEADNLEEGQQLVLELLTAFPGKPTPVPIERVVFPGERSRKLFINLAGPREGLLLRPVVEDWSKQLDVSGQIGKRQLRLRLVEPQAGNKEASLKFVDTETLKKKSEIVKDIFLDPTPPEILSLEVVPATPPVPAYRGRTLSLRARGVDPESDIREVLFFAGKPAPDGSIPPGAVVRKGSRPPKPQKEADKGAKSEKESDYWFADLPVPADQSGPFFASVRFVNHAGLSATSAPIAVEVKDPPPDTTPAVKASIAGVVREGSRPQPGVPVTLRNAAGQVVAEVKTGADGSYLFKDLEPGNYRVSAVNATLNIRGQTPLIELKAKEQKANQDISLIRAPVAR